MKLSEFKKFMQALGFQMVRKLDDGVSGSKIVDIKSIKPGDAVSLNIVLLEIEAD